MLSLELLPYKTLVLQSMETKGKISALLFTIINMLPITVHYKGTLIMKLVTNKLSLLAYMSA